MNRFMTGLRALGVAIAFAMTGVPANAVLQTDEAPPAAAVSFTDGITTPFPAALRRTPARIAGTLEIAGQHFRFGSGGAGYSIPSGDYKITPDTVGDWGARHGAIGVAGNTIWDPRLRRYREGIEIHRDFSGGRLITEGCIAIDHWLPFLSALKKLLSRFGTVYLHVETGKARITPQPIGPLAELFDPHRLAAKIEQALADWHRILTPSHPRHERVHKREARHSHHQHYAGVEAHGWPMIEQASYQEAPRHHHRRHHGNDYWMASSS